MDSPVPNTCEQSPSCTKVFKCVNFQMLGMAWIKSIHRGRNANEAEILVV
jgi:hypothetical protein